MTGANSSSSWLGGVPTPAPSSRGVVAVHRLAGVYGHLGEFALVLLDSA